MLFSAERVCFASLGPDWGLAFTYDGFGDRTTQSVTKGSGPAVSLSINPANNRINSSGYTYDNNGNMKAMPGSTFVYDIENRMVQVTSSGSEYYGYDPWNRRVWKTTTTDGAGKIFFYGAMGELMGTFSCAAGCTTDPPTTVETNLHFAGKLIRWDNGATVLDRLGGVFKRSNVLASPQISQTSAYYPFGEERTATGQDRSKFATYYRDSKTSLDYAMNRYYNSSWGRFTTPDPYDASAKPGNPLSWNHYAYVGNDPINKNDPSGLGPVCDLVPTGEGEMLVCVWPFPGPVTGGYSLPLPRPPRSGTGGTNPGISVANTGLSTIAKGNFKSKQKCRDFFSKLIEENHLKIGVDDLMNEVMKAADEATGKVYDGPSSSTPITADAFPGVDSSRFSTVSSLFAANSGIEAESQFNGAAIWVRANNWASGGTYNSGNSASQYGLGTLLHEILHKKMVSGGFTHSPGPEQLEDALRGIKQTDTYLGRNWISYNLGEICF